MAKSGQQQTSRRGFQYDKIISSQKRDDLKEHARIINGMLKTMSEYAIDIGRRLNHARSIVESGHFLEWLEEEFGMSRSAAYRYINAARLFGSCQEYFQPAALDLLAAVRAPKEVQRTALKIAKNGQMVTEVVARQLIDEHRTTHDTTEEDILHQAIADVERIERMAGALAPNGQLKVAKALIDAGRNLGPIRIHAPSRRARKSMSDPTEEGKA